MNSSRNVTIIDYGVGNLLSVQRGLEACGAKVTVTSEPELILNSQRVVLPGVGAFPNAMEALYGLNLVDAIREYALMKKPLLAICLGMQLLLEESEEFNPTLGLGLIPGKVIAIPKKSAEGEEQKIPHIGWSALQIPDGKNNWLGTLMQDIEVGESAYFLHSFMAQVTEQKDLIAFANYGGTKISAVISRESIMGCQFHPEKSGEIGLKILRNFVAK